MSPAAAAFQLFDQSSLGLEVEDRIDAEGELVSN